MTEDLRRLARRLVVGRKSGINTNQLYRWVRERRERGVMTSAAAAREAFVSMAVAAGAATAITTTATAADERSAGVRMNLHARLPNGVMLDVHGIELQHAVDVIDALGRMRCSASTRA
jgi:transposase